MNHSNPKKDQATVPELIEGEDYFINEDGLFVFTEKYHLKRGYCCKSGCQHCPYGYLKNSLDFKDSPHFDK
jgi:hypothetical protein